MYVCVLYTKHHTHSLFLRFLQKSSLLEHHHIHAAHGIIAETGLLQHLEPEVRKEVLEVMDELILATDIYRHKEIIGQFESRLQSGIDLSKKEDRRLAMQVRALC